MISNQKNLKQYNEGKDIKVYINENLTSTRAKLFSTVRKLQKDKHFSQVWTYNGNIRVKDHPGTVKSVDSVDDIQKYLPHIRIEIIYPINRMFHYELLESALFQNIMFITDDLLLLYLS